MIINSIPHNPPTNPYKSPKNDEISKKRESLNEHNRNNNIFQQKISHFEENDTKGLSNTHDFDHEQKEIKGIKRENSRKSMSNLHSIKKKNNKKLIQERLHENNSEFSAQFKTKESTNQSSNQPINLFSSSSSLKNPHGIIDLGNKKRNNSSHRVINKKDNKRHETIEVEKQQKTKPLIGKKKPGIIKRHETMNSFEGNESQNPTLTSNTIANNHQQNYSRNLEEEKGRMPSSNSRAKEGKIYILYINNREY